MRVLCVFGSRVQGFIYIIDFQYFKILNHEKTTLNQGQNLEPKKTVQEVQGNRSVFLVFFLKVQVS